MKNLDQFILESLNGYKPGTIKGTKKHKEQLPEDCTGYFTNQKVDVDDIENLDTSNVMHMGYMFSRATFNQTSIDLSSWDVSNVTSIDSMFCNCESLKALDLSDWDVSNVKNISYMFDSCRYLEYLDVSGWDTSNITYAATLFTFRFCFNLTNIIFGPGWFTSKDIETLDLGYCGKNKGYKLSDETYESMLTMYDREKAGLYPVTIYFNKRHNIPDDFKNKMAERGYYIRVR